MRMLTSGGVGQRLPFFVLVGNCVVEQFRSARLCVVNDFAFVAIDFLFM